MSRARTKPSNAESRGENPTKQAHSPRLLGAAPFLVSLVNHGPIAKLIQMRAGAWALLDSTKRSNLIPTTECSGGMIDDWAENNSWVSR